MLTFQQESWGHFVSDPARPDLWRQHYEALAPFPREEHPMSVDLSFYEAMERAGQMMLMTARLDGKLVGYYIVRVTRHPRYSLLAAFEDSYWLSTEARSAGEGLNWRKTPGARFIAEVENALKQRGVHDFYKMETEIAPIAPLLKRGGYEKSHTCWRKRLKAS